MRWIGPANSWRATPVAQHLTYFEHVTSLGPPDKRRQEQAIHDTITHYHLFKHEPVLSGKRDE